MPGEPADHALGRSRGGWTTKVHLAADASQTVMSLKLTAGQRSDSPQFQPVPERISAPASHRAGPTPARCRSSRTRPTPPELTAPTCAAAVSRPRPPRRRTNGATGSRKAAEESGPPQFDREAYKERNTLERTIGRLKRYRGVSTGYDKLAVRHEATIQVAILLDRTPRS